RMTKHHVTIVPGGAARHLPGRKTNSRRVTAGILGFGPPMPMASALKLSQPGGIPRDAGRSFSSGQWAEFTTRRARSTGRCRSLVYLIMYAAGEGGNA